METTEVSALEVLELLELADSLYYRYFIRRYEQDGTPNGYLITVEWSEDGHSYIGKAHIDSQGLPTWKSSSNFYTLKDDLNDCFLRREEEKVRAEKRRELLNRLTGEERELLGYGPNPIY